MSSATPKSEESLDGLFESATVVEIKVELPVIAAPVQVVEDDLGSLFKSKPNGSTNGRRLQLADGELETLLGKHLFTAR